MRLLHALVLIPLFSTPVFAQNLAPPVAEHHARKSAAEHFADANTTHDGHLTLDQAKTGYKSLAKSFTKIDTDHHGYITMDDIKAWKLAKKAAKQNSTTSRSGTLPPTAGVGYGVSPTVADTSTHLPAQSPRNSAVLPMAPLEHGHSS